MLKKTTLLVFVLIMFCLGVMAHSGNAVALTQYDGSVIDAYMVENNGLTYYEDKDNNLIVKKGDTFYYGTFDGTNIVATENVVGESNPLFLDLVPYTKSEQKGFEATTFESLSSAVFTTAKPVVVGSITPIFLLLNSSKTEQDLPSYIVDEFNDYLDNATMNIQAGSVAYNEDGEYYRQDIAGSLVLSGEDYYYCGDVTDTIEEYAEKIAEAIKGNESVYDVNGDGFIDNIVLVSPAFYGVSVYNVDDVEVGSLNAYYYGTMDPDSFIETIKLSYVLGEKNGFSVLHPFEGNIMTNAVFGKVGDESIAEDERAGVLAQLSTYNINSYLNTLTRSNVGYSGTHVGQVLENDEYQYEEIELDGLGAWNIANAINNSTAMSTDVERLDQNGDGFVDYCMVIVSDEAYAGAYEYNDLTTSFVEYKNTGLYFSKILLVGSSSLTNSVIDEKLSSNLNYRTLQRKNNDYRPAYQLDFMGGRGSYDFVPTSIYAQRQAGYITTIDEGGVYANTGIQRINEDNIVDKKGNVKTFEIYRSTDSPTKKTPIAFVIESPNSEDEEFWVEFREPMGQMGDTKLNNEPDAGLYIYRVNKKLEGYGNYYSGQGENYIADEVYYFRYDGVSDYGITSGLYYLNGDSQKANFGVYGRREFSYSTNPRAFFSNGRDNVDFSIYDIKRVKKDGEEDTMTFKVKYGVCSPVVDTVTPNSVNIEADEEVFNEFTSSFSYEIGAVNLQKTVYKWKTVDETFLELTYDTYFNEVTVKDAYVQRQGGIDIKDVTYQLGDVDENGNDIIVETENFMINLTTSTAKIVDQSLYVTYMIAPKESFVKTIGEDYEDGQNIFVYCSVYGYDGSCAHGQDNDSEILKGVFGYTLREPLVSFDSITPINKKNYDLYLENTKVKGSYSEGKEDINHLGVVYSGGDSTAVIFDYMPNVLKEYEIPFEKDVPILGVVTGTIIVDVSGFFGADLNNNNIKDSVLAITDFKFKIEDLNKEKGRTFIEDYIKEHYMDFIKERYPDATIINWNVDDLYTADPMVIGDGLVKVAASSFKLNETGDTTLGFTFGPEFDKEKLGDMFETDIDVNQAIFNIYGLTSLNEDLSETLQKVFAHEYDENTDFRYMGYLGLGGDTDISEPTIRGIDISPKPVNNPYISSQILPFDENIGFTVNYTPDKYDISDITFSLVDSAGVAQLSIKYNPITKIFYTYEPDKKKWEMSDFGVEHNINAGEFVIPCYCYKTPEDLGNGSYNFTFYARSKSRFADNPLYAVVSVTDQQGNASEPCESETSYIFRKVTGNVVPNVLSVTPSSGTISTQTATDFVLRIEDTDSYYDLNNIELTLSYGGIKECYAVYNFQENTIALLTEYGWTDPEVVGTDVELTNDNFTIDVANTYYKVIDSDEIELHISVIPLSAFSGNSIKVRAYADDIFYELEHEDKYVTKTFGYIEITTEDSKAVILNMNKLNLDIKETAQLKVINSNGEELNATWSVDNSDIATVVNGKVEGVNPGKTTVKATVNGKTYKCAVSVNNPKVENTKASGEVTKKSLYSNPNGEKGGYKVRESDKSKLSEATRALLD